MKTAELLTIEDAAKRLHTSAKTIKRKINDFRDRGETSGGWPPGRCWIDLNPSGERADIRICWEGLLGFLAESSGKSLGLDRVYLAADEPHTCPICGGKG